MQSILFSFDSEESSLDLNTETPSNMDGLDESSKSKKKHKKHKKHKKQSRHDDETKERSRSSKKHKKHKRKHKGRDGSTSNSESDEHKKIKLPESTKSQVPTTLNKKFTEIMKSNGRVVVAKVPTTKIFPNNGNGSSAIASIRRSKITTDPNKLVELITQSLDSKIPSMEIVSSESESDAVQDVDSPDVAVIEDDLNLDELMKQKALLQASLEDECGVAAADDSVHRSQATSKPRPIDKSRDGPSVAAKRQPESSTDVILLDDSSGEAIAKHNKKRMRTSPGRDRTSKDKRPEGHRDRDSGNRQLEQRQQQPDRSSKGRRSDNENRFKEDLRKEIDRDKERNYRDNQRRRDNVRAPERRDGNKSRYSIERDNRRQSARSRSRDRDRNNRGNMRSRNERDDRYRSSGNGNNDYRRRRDDKNDKFVGSLSEGQKPERDSSSESDIGNLNLDDDDDEEKIIENRRKKREELLKVSSTTTIPLALAIH